MPVFDYTFTVPAPLEAVARFHHDTRALKRLTPPPIWAQMHHLDPLGEGSVSKFTLWFGPLPFRWVAVHSQVSANGFTDTQQSGPMQKWVHTHRFTAEGGGTRIHEHIEYEHFPGGRGWLTRLLFAPPALSGLFFYRRLVTRAALTA